MSDLNIGCFNWKQIIDTFSKKRKRKKETNSIYHSSYKSTMVFMHELNLLKKISDKLGLRFSMVLFSIFISSCKNSCIF